MIQNITEPFVIAHRGASAYLPENTLAAMQRAHELGAQMVEFDVQLAACGTAVVFHDDDLLAFNDTPHLIADYTVAELSQLVPTRHLKRFVTDGFCTLQALLTILKNWGMHANIELKSLSHQNGQQLIQQILQDVQQTGFLEENIVFSSFDINLLVKLRQQNTSVAIAALFDAQTDPITADAALSLLNLWSINVLEPYIKNREDVDYLKTFAPRVYCATVNNPVRAQQLFSYGVNAVFSDYPDLLVKDAQQE